jgi:hypothetical protein
LPVAIKLSSDFLQGSNIYKLSENYTKKLFVLSFALARRARGTIFPVVREITLMTKKNVITTYQEV